LLTFSQQLLIGPHPEPDEFILHVYTLSLLKCRPIRGLRN